MLLALFTTFVFSNEYLNPNGNLLLNTSRKQTFQTPEGELNYSASKQVEYENKPLPVSMDFKRRDPLKKGDYLIEVYIEGLLVGNQKFFLK